MPKINKYICVQEQIRRQVVLLLHYILGHVFRDADANFRWYAVVYEAINNMVHFEYD
jgi:hypothetical protein